MSAEFLDRRASTGRFYHGGSHGSKAHQKVATAAKPASKEAVLVVPQQGDRADRHGSALRIRPLFLRGNGQGRYLSGQRAQLAEELSAATKEVSVRELEPGQGTYEMALALERGGVAIGPGRSLRAQEVLAEKRLLAKAHGVGARLPWEELNEAQQAFWHRAELALTDSLHTKEPLSMEQFDDSTPCFSCASGDIYFGYGLAAGGIGAYAICGDCSLLLAFTADSE